MFPAILTVLRGGSLGSEAEVRCLEILAVVADGRKDKVEQKRVWLHGQVLLRWVEAES